MYQKRASVLSVFIAVVVFSLCTQVRAKENESQLPAKALFTHFMISFATPEVSGSWRGWEINNHIAKHNPERIWENGKRDIASRYYPIIGPYDMTDPYLVEYHVQLMKMSGIDGAMFDLTFFVIPHENRQKALFTQTVMRLYVKYLKQYGLKAVAVFEDKSQWIWNAKHENRAATVAATFQDLENWLELISEVQYSIGEQPLVCVFSYEKEVLGRGVSRLLPKEIEAWKQKYPKQKEPIVLVQWYKPEYQGTYAGFFEWPEIRGDPPTDTSYVRYNSFQKEKAMWQAKQKHTLAKLEKGEYTFVGGGVWPGFDDEGCMGWGGGQRVIPRYDGKIYQHHWERIMAHDYSVVQIATWNDWMEGSNIEPSREFGYTYLEMTREYAQKWKGTTIETGDFKIPAWIYDIRKKHKDSKALQVCDQASQAISRGEFKKAEEILQIWMMEK
jgi:glycoprotein endo-alpha-1,2-mannosidase